MIRKPISTAPSVPTPPNGSATSFARPKPSASRTKTIARSSRKPRTRCQRSASWAGEIRPISRSTKSWREDGGAWPSFSIASFNSSGLRSAWASDAFMSWRRAGRSRGLHPTSASLKYLRACWASYFSAARAPRMALAAARCFVSLRSCSSVRSSSCWIAPSVPTWYCIFVCRCLATAVSLRSIDLERLPSDPLQAVPEANRRGCVHTREAPALRPQQLASLLRDRHRQHGVAELRRVEELPRADREPANLLTALHLHGQPQNTAALQRRPARHPDPDALAVELHTAAGDDEAPADRPVQRRRAVERLEQVARHHVARVGRRVRLEAELVVVLLGRLRQQRARDPDAPGADFQLADRDPRVDGSGVACTRVGRGGDHAPARLLPRRAVDVVLTRVRLVAAARVL